MIWERWAERNEAALLTFAMVTVAANRLIGEITDRMPAVIAPEHWGTWLGETDASAAELKALLVPHEGDWTMRPQQKNTKKPKKNDTQQTLF